MILAHYLPKMLTALFGGLFIVLGIFTFGEALLFDRIYLGVLIFTAIICRKDINVLGVVIILALERGSEELSWFATETNFEILTKLGFYTVAGALGYSLRYDKVSKILLASLFICLAAEAYWQTRGVQAPQIFWYMAPLTLNLLTRHLIFVRVSYTEDYFPNKAQSINLDWHIYKLSAVSAVVQCLMITEYVLRGVLDLTSMLYFYNLYPYVMHAVGTYVVWIIFHESYKLLLPKLLKA